MRETKKCEVGGCCGCEGCHDRCCASGQYHWQLLLRWFLGLIIIVLVFNLGMKIGEIKSALLDSVTMPRWERVDRSWLLDGGSDYPVSGMMRRWVKPENAATPTPTAESASE